MIALLCLLLAPVTAKLDLLSITGLYVADDDTSSLFISKIGANGAVQETHEYAVGQGLSWCEFHSSLPVFYCVHEQFVEGHVSAFSLDTQTFKLKALGTVSSGGAAPVYLSVKDNYLLVANYNETAPGFASITLNRDGTLGEIVDAHHTNTSAGLSHGHSVVVGPNGNIYGVDLGLDMVHQFYLKKGRFIPNPAQSHVQFPEATGPRHLRFHPTNSAHSIIANEGLGAAMPTIRVCHFDPNTQGIQCDKSPINTMTGTGLHDMYPAEILFAPSGKYAYVSNRDHSTALRDNIAVFNTENMDNVKLIANYPCGGSYPRSMSLTPDGQSLFVGNQWSNNTALFHVNTDTGGLTLKNASVASYSNNIAFVGVFQVKA